MQDNQNTTNLSNEGNNANLNVASTVVVKKKSSAGVIILVAVILSGGILAGGKYFYESTRPVSKYELDKSALEGWLPGKTKEEIENELNRIIDESRFNVSINPLITVEGGVATLHIENVPANHYDMQVDLILDKTGETIFSSGLIKPGSFLELGQLSPKPEMGVYNVTANFKALVQETQEDVGTTAVKVLISVRD